MMLIDLRSKDENLTGKLAENTLVKCDITVNKNAVPFETRSPFITSGIRIGTPAITTRGLKEVHMEKIATLIDEALSNHDNDEILKSVGERVRSFMKEFPLYQ
jgi:glycine hydroxymethyltransferase